MAKGDEAVSPSTNSSAVPPGDLLPAGAQPTPEQLLAWIGAAKDQPWFPSRHSSSTGADRDALDEPLSVLRAAGLVRVAEWERGVGQGYLLTPQGEAALSAGGAIPQPAETPATPAAAVPEPAPAVPSNQPQPDPPWPVVVMGLFVLNLLWFVVGLVLLVRAGLPVWPYLYEGNLDIAHRTGAVSSYDLLRGQWWRLLTACFVHGHGAHLLINLFALVLVGPLAEDLWRRWRLIAIYLFSGLAGSCLAMALAPATVQAGASGAIWGLLMSIAAWLILFRKTLDHDVVVEAAQRLTVCIVLNAMFSFLPGISWQGHLGGAVAGFVVAILLHAMGSTSRRRRVVAAALLIAFMMTSVGGLVAAMHSSKAWAGARQALADEETRRATRSAMEAYDRDVAPRLAELSPAKVKAANELLGYHGYQLMRPPERRNQARIAEARARFTELKGVADAVVKHLDGFAAGAEAIARRGEQARAFAAARSKSYAIVLAMLDSPAIPDQAAWAEWEKARAEADALWPKIAR